LQIEDIPETLAALAIFIVSIFALLALAIAVLAPIIVLFACVATLSIFALNSALSVDIPPLLLRDLRLELLRLFLAIYKIWLDKKNICENKLIPKITRLLRN
jgi:hypothetical protein